MTGRIAVVGMSLRYPDADNLHQFWENILGRRQAFRAIPNERMNKADYWSSDPQAADRFYATSAAVLRNFDFDRKSFGVSGSTFRSTDMTHWLALTVAQECLSDAGLLTRGKDHSRTAVVIGNSLTGEFSRANLMRLRWPYVSKVVSAGLAEQGWEPAKITNFLTSLEEKYKAPFPPITEDTLAGGLSNTIAGRICNHFDLGGGGYTVDGACSSSLLSITTAARSLIEGDVDHVVAGGVDLSIDPFEVVGFAKTKALSRSEMTIYDKDSDGFWPGEGCGLVVLMREEDAIAADHQIYATLTGWGVSSDGAGGLTRPEESGHRAAINRAYARAGYDVSTVGYFEGHGTGTALGDATEIHAISNALLAADVDTPVALGSIKGNIGHTKAAAGVAGFIKACLALHTQTIPPVTGNVSAHPALEGSLLRLPQTPEPFAKGNRARCGVSAMGFGGINTHVTLEAVTTSAAPMNTQVASHPAQDSEIFIFAALDPADLRVQVESATTQVHRLSLAELGDVAAALTTSATQTRTHSKHPHQAAIVARTPQQALHRLTALLEAIDAETQTDFNTGIFYAPQARGRIGFVFPGQGSPSGRDDYLSRRFLCASAVKTPTMTGSTTDTQVAQPRILTDSLRGLAVLDQLGLRAQIAAGHSLGELTALHWAGAFDVSTVRDVVLQRGRVMSEFGSRGGAMASIAAPAETAQALTESITGTVVVSGHNSPDQTTISGDRVAVDQVVEAAREYGLLANRLAVSHAFHSPHMERAAVKFKEALAEVHPGVLTRPVVSSRTGRHLAPDVLLADHLANQIVEPVQWHQAITELAKDVDLVIEVGPGAVLSGVAGLGSLPAPVISIRADSPSSTPLLSVVAAAFAVGADVDVQALFEGRVVRPMPEQMTFFASPCEDVPTGAEDRQLPSEILLTPNLSEQANSASLPDSEGAFTDDGRDVLEQLLDAVAIKTELPRESLSASTHPLDDLHLSSITVNQIAAEMTQALGRGTLPATTNLATATLGDLSDAIEQSGSGNTKDDLAGVGPWVRAFEISHPSTRRSPVRESRSPGQWTSACSTENVARLVGELSSAAVGPGVVVWAQDESVVSEGEMLRACQDVVALEEGTLVVIDHGVGAAGFARSFALEYPAIKVVIVTPSATDPPSEKELVEHVVAEASHGRKFVESALSSSRRTEPLLSAWTSSSHRAEAPLHPGEVMVFTGGGKGIVAECALRLAQQWEVAVGLVGRADPESDPELKANLQRMQDVGARWHYVQADVTDQQAVNAAVQEIEKTLGDVAGVVHGAGLNTPTPISDLTVANVATTYSVKVDGFRHVMAALNDQALRLVVTFGSIIGRAGLQGEAHYAAANDRVRVMTEQFADTHRDVRVRALEWSVWSGAGMGESLGVLSALQDQGITAVGLNDGLDMLVTLLQTEDAPTTSVIAGRMGDLATLRRETTPLPLHRFLENARVHYPGVELITDSTLSVGSDLYLQDHSLDGDLLFPAVMGIEAMTQVALAASGHKGPVALTNVQFLRPVVVPTDASLTIRVSALVGRCGEVEVALRTSATQYSEDHFRATVGPGSKPPEPPPTLPTASEGSGALSEELYGAHFFQGKRFHRVLGYRDFGAKHAVAMLDPHDAHPWFATHLPPELQLGSPGVRDALMHALQCCVPTAVLLPMSVDRIDVTRDFGGEQVRMDAVEVQQQGNEYVYNVAARGADGVVLEIWTGLRLRAVRPRTEQMWSAPFLAGHLERACAGIGNISIALEAGLSRRIAEDKVLSLAAHRDVRVGHQLGDRARISDGSVSVSHIDEVLSLAVVSDRAIQSALCPVADLEFEDWATRLGPELLPLLAQVQALVGEDVNAAASRVWVAVQCLTEAGVARSGITVQVVTPGVVQFRRDFVVVFTVIAEIVDNLGTFAVAIGGEVSHDFANRSI